MSDPAPNQTDNPDLWESATPVDRAVSDPGFTVDIDGYEGPLDLLLALARTQKVDLAKISILQLSIQYLEFVEKARKLRLELAADYLVMAAWLAFLKSKLLLPEPDEEEGPSGEDLANQLAFRLRRLEAMREASTRLMNRNRLGRDVFARGDPEPVIVHREQRYTATMYDLLSAYAAQKQRQAVSTVTIAQRQVWSLSEAREILARLIGGLADWTPLDVFLSHYLDDGPDRRGVLASTFAASLEMVREGAIEVQQAGNFEPLYIRRQNTKLADSLAEPA